MSDIDSPSTVVDGLAALGWDDSFDRAFHALPSAPAGVQPGRVMAEHRGGYRVSTAAAEILAELAGRFRFAAVARADLPVVGDWVALSGGMIHAVVPRRTALVRRDPDPRVGDQVLAANVDVAFLVTSLNRDFNLRRLERYLAMAWSSGAQPVVVLSKADLVADAEEYRGEVARVAVGVPVVVVSVPLDLGLEEVRAYLPAGSTAVFLGSSGVGKSTVINALAGAATQATAAVREDDARGRHTTTTRQLLALPGGWLVIDTPGLRSIELPVDGADLGRTFADVDELASACRFSDCGHDAEPGCAVHAAIADGRLDPARLAGHRKLEREVARTVREVDPVARAAHRAKWRAISRSVNFHMNRKYGADG